jgi:hypothetical protein
MADDELGKIFFWTGHPVHERVFLDDSYYENELYWDSIQQERDGELEIDGDDNLPLIDKVVDIKERSKPFDAGLVWRSTFVRSRFLFFT